MVEQPDPLDYASPPQPERAPVVEWASLGVIAGVPVALFGLFAAYASASNDQGHAFIAKLLFPYLMLGTRSAGHYSALVILLAIAQFPLYMSPRRGGVSESCRFSWPSPTCSRSGFASSSPRRNPESLLSRAPNAQIGTRGFVAGFPGGQSCRKISRSATLMNLRIESFV